MSETPRILADFLGTFSVEDRHGRDAVQGRVLLSPRELVLAGPDSETRIPLADLLDIGVGKVPNELARFFDNCVTVAFRRGGRPRVAVVEAKGDAIERFSEILFKTQLNGSTVLLNHPARIGGSVIGARFVSSDLYLEGESVAFTEIETPFRIDLDAVIDFQQQVRTVREDRREVISVRHLSEGKTMVTEVVLESARRQNLLGRYLRLVYRSRLDALGDTDLATTEKRLLYALHTGGAVESLAGVVDVDPGEVSTLLDALEEKGLIAPAGDGTRITPAGRILIGEFLDDVNE